MSRAGGEHAVWRDFWAECFRLDRVRAQREREAVARGEAPEMFESGGTASVGTPANEQRNMQP